jgi:glutamate-5-semialdehyde dehydrogenase
VSLWHQALTEIKCCFLGRVFELWPNETSFFEKPTQKVDLIVPRGGENLINFVKKRDLSSNCEW